MVNDISSSQPSESLAIPVQKLIFFSIVDLEPTSDNSQNFSWLPFEGASGYIVQLSNSQEIVFRDRVSVTNANKQKQTYPYKETLLQPGEDYLFTVEIDREHSCLDRCHVNNEKKIAEYVAQGINNIKALDLFSDLKISILAQLDSLLINRDEILNVIWGLIRQGSNSEIICFLNYFLAQGSALQLLANSTSSDDILEALCDIASQLAAANITLGKYLYLSELQTSLADDLLLKGLELSYFPRKFQIDFGLKQFAVRGSSDPCHPDCKYLPPHIRCSASYRKYCGGCPECE